jgi:hypothetical protein
MTANELPVWTGAPRSPKRTPDFLSTLMALTNFMRLSLMKAAHAAVGWRPVAENPGTWDENGLFPLLSAGSTAMVGASPHRFRPTYAEANVGHPSCHLTVSGQAGTVESC